jgi:hypothetical protein
MRQPGNTQSSVRQPFEKCRPDEIALHVSANPGVVIPEVVVVKVCFLVELFGA